MYFIENIPRCLKEAMFFESMDWCFKELNIPEHVRIVVEFADSQFEASVLDDEYDPEEDDERWFTIEISKKIDPSNINRAIIHEMIHIVQFLDGRLSYHNGKAHWCGVCMDGVPYDKQPWEVEAYAKELELLQKFERNRLLV